MIDESLKSELGKQGVFVHLAARFRTGLLRD